MNFGETLTDEHIVSIVRNEVQEFDKDDCEIVVLENKVCYSTFVESIDTAIKFNEQKKCLNNSNFNLVFLPDQQFFYK